MLVDRAAGKRALELAHEVARLVGPPREPSSDEREERAAARTRAARSRRSSPRGACRGRRRTSRDRLAAARASGRSMGCLASPDGRRQSARRPDRDLVPDRGRRRARSATARSQASTVDDERAGSSPRACAASSSRARGARRSGRTSPSSRPRRDDGSVFVVRDGDAADRRDDAAGADRRPRLLRPEELPARRWAERTPKPKRAAAKRAPRKKTDAARVGSDRRRRVAAGSLAGAVLLRRRAARRRERVDLYFEDGSLRLAHAGLARRGAPAASRARAARRGARVVDRDELGAALREHAYLEGDFVLRSGRRSRYYLDKYRFETRPDLLGPLGELIAEAVARARAGRGAARRPRARRRRARRRGLAGVGPARS